MTIVSTKEFHTNQDKYLDMAVNGNVCIRDEKYLFHLICSRVDDHIENSIIFQPNDELRNCITMDEVRSRTRKRIHDYFASKQQ